MTPDHRLIARRAITATARHKRGRGPAQCDPAYLLWIRTLPCLVCSKRQVRQRTPTEAHHFGPRAFGTKSPDRYALPLCQEHHRTRYDAAHRLGRMFAHHHRLEPLAEIGRLNQIYDAERGGSAA